MLDINDFINKCNELRIYDNEYDVAIEVKLTKEERDALPDDAFGLPKKRKYPLILTKPEDRTENDKDGGSHIRNAIAFFHYCKEEDRKELAENIMKAIKKYDLDIKISKNNLIRKYVKVDKRYDPDESNDKK